MTCKDCLYYEVCPLGLAIQGKTGTCLKFKNKADFVEVVRCEKCKYFREYSDAYKRAVERADGDCYLKLIHSCDEQFIACRYNDFCSYGERKTDDAL